MSEFVSSLSGVFLGGLIVLVGQHLEARRVHKRWILDNQKELDNEERAFRRASLVALQDDLVEFCRAAIQAWEHREAAAWEPTRYDGARLRVIGVSSRLGDSLLNQEIKDLLAAASALVADHPGAQQSDLTPFSECAMRRIATLLECFGSVPTTSSADPDPPTTQPRRIP